VLTYHYSGSFPVRGGVMVGAGVWRHGGGRRSAAYASMCGPLLPFLREGRPGGGGPGFFRDGRHVSGYGPESGALCGRLGAGVVAYVPRYGAYVPPLPGSTGNGFVSGALLPLVASPGGMRRPHILRSVEELRVICRVFRAGGCVGMRRYASVWFTCEVRVLARNVTVRHA